MLQIIRLLQLINELNKNDFVSSKDLASKLETSRRTVMRDIQVLKDAGCSIKSDRNGYFLESKEKSQFSLSLSGEEKFTIIAGLQMLYDTKDPSLQIISARLVEKLFGGDFMSDFLKTPSLLKESTIEPNTSKIVRRIRAAVDNRKVIKFRYLKPGEISKPKLRKANPLAVFFRRHAYYMIAFCHKRNQIRMFRVSRICDLIMTRETFKSTDFNLNDFLEPAFELNPSGQISEVELRFTPKVAPFIGELIWHPSQRISKNSDGSVTLMMKVAINEELARWVLSYGSECTIVSPVLLIDIVKNHLYSLKQYYNI